MTGARSHGEATVDILSVEDVHTGDYTCVANTELDRKEAMAHLDVLDVPKPPYTPTIVTVCGTKTKRQVDNLCLNCFKDIKVSSSLLVVICLWNVVP